jgi:hypothetical protein
MTTMAPPTTTRRPTKSDSSRHMTDIFCEPQGTLCNKEVGVAVAVAQKSQKIVPSRTIECRPDRCQFVEIATNGSDKQRLSHEFNCTSIAFK